MAPVETYEAGLLRDLWAQERSHGGKVSALIILATPRELRDFRAALEETAWKESWNKKTWMARSGARARIVVVWTADDMNKLKGLEFSFIAVGRVPAAQDWFPRQVPFLGNICRSPYGIPGKMVPLLPGPEPDLMPHADLEPVGQELVDAYDDEADREQMAATGRWIRGEE